MAQQGATDMAGESNYSGSGDLCSDPVGDSQLAILTRSSSTRRVRDSVSWQLWVVAFIGFWERAAFWGLTAPWQNYMENPSDFGPNETPGALGLGQSVATRIYCGFYIFYYVTPLFFAIISDSYIGRYKTLILSIVLYNAGCAVLTFTSLPYNSFVREGRSSFAKNLDKGQGFPGLISAMALIGLGAGGFRAIMVPFIADQYTDGQAKIKTLRTGEKVVTDRALTLQYVYNLYYWIGNVGSLSWFATVYIEKILGFTAAYGLTLAFTLIALSMLAFGGKWYVKAPHEGNILPKATKVLVYACKNGCRLAHADPEYQITHRNKTVPWSSELVCELGRGLRACRVLLAFVVFYVCFDQMQNNLISQASDMVTESTPNDVLPAMNQVGCIILGPLIQNVFYPYLHKRKIYLQPILRITIGFMFISLAMLYATVVQHIIYANGPCYELPKHCTQIGRYQKDGEGKPNDVNVWIQAPVYFFIAAGEIFAYVTGLEYAYDHSPRDMKVIVQAISLLIAGLGSACAMALTPVAHDPHLVIFYACLAGAMAATTLIFWLIFRRYDKRIAEEQNQELEKELKNGPEGARITHQRSVSVLRLPPHITPDMTENSLAPPNAAVDEVLSHVDRTTSANNSQCRGSDELDANIGNALLEDSAGRSVSVYEEESPGHAHVNQEPDQVQQIFNHDSGATQYQVIDVNLTNTGDKTITPRASARKLPRSEPTTPWRTAQQTSSRHASYSNPTTPQRTKPSVSADVGKRGNEWWENPRKAPPLPSWRVSKCVLKSTSASELGNHKLNCGFEDNFVEDTEAEQTQNNLAKVDMDKPKAEQLVPQRRSSAPQQRASTLYADDEVYETAYEHLVSTAGVASATTSPAAVDHDVSAHQVTSQPRRGRKGDREATTSSVSTIVARYETLSSSNESSTPRSSLRQSAEHQDDMTPGTVERRLRPRPRAFSDPAAMRASVVPSIIVSPTESPLWLENPRTPPPKPSSSRNTCGQDMKL